MLQFKARALMSKSEIRRRDTLNIASKDPGVDWQMMFYDINTRDNVTDPGTNRTVTGVVYTTYHGDAVDQGQDGTLGYNANYPFSNLVMKAPGKFTITQVGGPVPAGDDLWALEFDVILL